MDISWSSPKDMPYPKDRSCAYFNGLPKLGVVRFKRISDVLYSDRPDMYHVRWVPSLLSHSGKAVDELLKDDFKRISLSNSPSLDNPKYLFASLSNDNGIVKFGSFKDGHQFKWTITGKHIKYKRKYLNIYNGTLVVSGVPDEWEICNSSKIRNVRLNVYLTCDMKYNVVLTKDVYDAVPFKFENDGIHYIKPPLRVGFEMNNIINGLNADMIYDIYKKGNKSGINVCILLAAGTGSRFGGDEPKQLFNLDCKSVVMYSVDVFVNVVDHIIIVTNSRCYDEIHNLTETIPKITLVINDHNCRQKSIEKGISYVNNNYDVNKIIIHDSARPFITEDHFKQLLKDNHPYSQYCLKLVNGLYSHEIKEMADRDRYTDICTPVISDFELFYFIFDNYIADKNRITYEHISILDLLGIKYNLVQGTHMHLRKITFRGDVC